MKILYAALSGWERLERCQAFVLFLNGNASLWFSGLPARVKQSFADITDAFLIKFEPAQEIQNLSIFRRQQQPTESFESYRIFSNKRPRLNKRPLQSLIFLINAPLE